MTNAVTLETVHTHTHTHTMPLVNCLNRVAGLLVESKNKIEIKNKDRPCQFGLKSQKMWCCLLLTFRQKRKLGKDL